MSHFQAARKNMVECQIHPSGVVDDRILQAFETVPREQFVSKDHRGLSYKDQEIIMKDGRFVLDATTHARMIQALNLKSTDVVLDIGCAAGYSAAILSGMVSTVIAQEQKQKYLTDAEKLWNEHRYCNIVSFKGVLKSGCPNHGPYNHIILNGAVSEMPENIIQQLEEGGTAIFILKKQGQHMGQVTLVQYVGNKKYTSKLLFESSAPYLIGFEPKPAFKF